MLVALHLSMLLEPHKQQKEVAEQLQEGLQHSQTHDLLSSHHR